MEHCLSNLLFIVFVCLGGCAAFTLKHTMVRLNYIEDRLNAESRLRREDFNALFNKLENVETMLTKAIFEKVETGSETTNVRPGGHTISFQEQKFKLLLKAFKDEKEQNKRFRREITEEVNIQADQAKNAYKNTQARLDNITELLKKEVKNIENMISKNMEKVLQQIDLTKENDEGLSQSLTNVRNDLQKHSENVTNMQNIAKEHFKITQDIGLNVTQIFNMCENLEIKCSDATKKYTSCLHLYMNGFHTSGVYDIFIPASSDEATAVYCDMTTDYGGWTVFQRRVDGSVDFYRDWNDYKTGFGNLNGEFWLGNEYLNKLTDTEVPNELRIELGDFEGNRAYAKYKTFKIGPESTNYKLEVSGYTGDAGDSLEKKTYGNGISNRMSFSTKDRDNDNHSTVPCAVYIKGAWWYHRCYGSNLNGVYGTSGYINIYWYSWGKKFKNLKFTEMKLR